ncbi:MAG: RNA polymerase sigma factor [Candidatus Paceibacterota bacterium]|jgi:RNA polymerase sigma-70 factor (ECF subfamily)
MHTDEQLVQAYLNGDAEAFSLLVERYTNHIYNFVRRFITQKNDAEDITQEVFVKVWKHLPSFNTTKSFKVWLFTIAKNASFDYARRKYETVFSDIEDVHDEHWVEESIEDVASLPTTLFEKKEVSEFISRALQTLLIHERTVLLLHYENELTFEEIAEILKKPMNSVKSTHFRAIKKLQSSLVHQNNNEKRIK